jgi:rhodanese-related sulfurtransferase
MDTAITPGALSAALAQPHPPLVIDVRRTKAFVDAADMFAGGLRRSPEAVASWADHLPPASNVVVYCVHGHEVSQNAAKALRERGLKAQYLDHGIEGWREAGGALQIKPAGASTRWVTRARPRIDRIACPWLIRRFVDADAEIMYVPSAEVRATAEANHGTAFDIPGADFGHDGARCSFDAFLERYRLRGDPALVRLAEIVRAADTDRTTDSPQASGLLAISIGLGHLYGSDRELLAQGMIVYDALYRWCREQ